jgi:Family of unknown function (DUF5677)
VARAPKKQRPSIFKGHEQQGKRHLPPMRQLPIEPTMREFRKVAFPNFLWLLAMLQERPLSTGAGPTTQAQDLGQAAFGRAQARGALDDEREPVFHGLLTDWERVPETERAEVLEELDARGIYNAVVPEGLTHALAAYPDAPGRWLIGPRLAAGLEPSVEEAEKYLWETMRLGGTSHQSLATHAIYLWLRGLLIMRRISFPPEPIFIDILPRYPNDVNEGEAKMAESTLRAMFLSMAGAMGERPEALDWCQRFWRANRRLFGCVLETPDPTDPTDREKVEVGTAQAHRRLARFFVASQAVDPDLWDHDRYDVLTGMTWRVLRIAEHLIAHPAQWSEEHGYPAVRSMFEAVVQMTWMLKVEEARPTVWAEFKNFGRGKTKALKLHTEATHAKATGAEKETLEGVLKKLEQEVNRDVDEHFQDISTAGTFIDDMSLAAMAEEVGMGDLYRSTMGPASSALHGDWSALDDLYLDRCLHPLHGSHVIPRLKAAEESRESLPFLAETFSRWIFSTYCRATDYEPPSDAEAEGDPTDDDGSRGAP